MKLENQVCNLELSKELKELGVKQDSLWRWWYDFNLDKFILRHYKIIKQKDLLEMYSAFTVAELGESLPDNYLSCKDRRSTGDYEEYWTCYPKPVSRGRIDIPQSAKTEANCKAKMLIYLIKNNLVKLGIEKGGE